MKHTIQKHSQKTGNRAVWLVGLITLFMMLQSCGFHLRNSVELPTEMKYVWIDDSGVSSELMRELKNQLQNRDITIVNRERDASATLQVRNEKRTSRTVAVNPSGKVGRYRVTYEFGWTMKGTGDHTLKQGTAKRVEHYQYSSSEAAAKDVFAKQLEQEMIEGAVQDLLRALR